MSTEKCTYPQGCIGTKDWLEKVLDPNGKTSIKKMSAVEVAFRLVSKLASESGLATRIDEEAMTASLLGAMLATFPWSIFVVGMDQKDNCFWARYRKGGRSLNSESLTGADFALFLRRPGKVRLAIFQAKRFEGERDPAINVHHIPGSAEGAISKSQFISLKKHGEDVLKAKTGVAFFKAINFVHYAGYKEDGIWCMPISLLDDVNSWYESNKNKNEKDKDVEMTGNTKVTYSNRTWISFETVLLDGLKDDDSEHWIELDENVALPVFRELIPTMTVCEANDGKGGMRIFPKVYEVSILGDAPGDGPDPNQEEQELFTILNADDSRSLTP